MVEIISICQSGINDRSHPWDSKNLTFVLSMSFTFCIQMLWQLRPYGSWRDCPTLSYSILKDTKQLTEAHLSNANHQYRAHRACSILGSHTMSHYPPALITPGTWQLREVFMPQGLLQVFKLASPKPVYPAWPIPYTETTIEALVTFLPPLLLPPDPRRGFPSLQVPPSPSPCVFLLKSVSITNYYLNGSCLLICGPRHT